MSIAKALSDCTNRVSHVIAVPAGTIVIPPTSSMDVCACWSVPAASNGSGPPAGSSSRKLSCRALSAPSSYSAESSVGGRPASTLSKVRPRMPSQAVRLAPSMSSEAMTPNVKARARSPASTASSLPRLPRAVPPA